MMLNHPDTQPSLSNSTNFFTAGGGDTLVEERPLGRDREPHLHGRSYYERNPRRYPPIRYVREDTLRAVSLQARISKRCFDIIAALVLGILAIPLIAVIAIWVKLDSPGNVFFSQMRPGRYGKRFKIYKFRTMHIDAEQRFARLSPELRAEFEQYGKIKNDPRITRAGYWLRRLSLDELPQLWNVLRGEMSLIGPRPEQVPFVHEFSKEIPFYSWRHRVKPGVTGWAQVQQGYTSGLEDTMIKLEYDLYYVKHVSFWLDLFIALKTVWIMVTGWGAK